MTQQPGVAEQRLYDAVALWSAETGFGPGALIDAACQALVDGLDSPTLRDLASASARDSSWEARGLVTRALEELAIPAPSTIPAGFVVAAGGGVARRPGINTLRLDVTPASAPTGGQFQVLVYVDGVEMTSAGAGLGMDPYDILVPTNRFVATSRSHRVPIARCTCGVYGCGPTDVTITRDIHLVHWDWSLEVPMNRGVWFDGGQYDAEVARTGADHSWETPERTAGRLVLTRTDRARAPPVWRTPQRPSPLRRPRQE